MYVWVLAWLQKHTQKFVSIFLENMFDNKDIIYHRA